MVEDLSPGAARDEPSRGACWDRDDGLSLVELIVALFILAILLTGTISGLMQALSISRDGRSRTVATNLASGEIELLRQATFDEIDLGRTTRTHTVGTQPYTITRDVSWVAEDSTASSCEGGSGTGRLAYLRVDVDVTWPSMGVPNVEADTLITPPVHDFDPYAGHVSVAIKDRDGKPQPGVEVMLQEVTIVGSTRTRTGPILRGRSDADGCVFFPYVNQRADLSVPPAVDDYDLWVDEPGFVDVEDMLQEKVEAITVGIAETAKVPLEYDRAADVQVTLAPENGSPLLDYPLTWVRRGGTEPPPVVEPGTGLVRDLTDLYPFDSGYHVYLGACDDADPQVHGGQKAIATTDQGGSSTLTIPIPDVRIVVTDEDGDDVAGRAITGTHCGQSYALGTTDAAGRLQVALPYGSWQFEVAGEVPLGGTWPTYAVTAATTGTPDLGITVDD